MRVPVGFRNPVSQVHPVLSYIPEEAIATSGAWRAKDNLLAVLRGDRSLTP
jgi:hypothetical protein